MQSIAPRLTSALATLLAVFAVAAPARAQGVAASRATPAPATRVLTPSLADRVFVSERAPMTVATPERPRARARRPGPDKGLLAPAAIALLALLGLLLVGASRRRRPAPPAAAAPTAPLRAVAPPRPARRRRPAIETDPALATSGRALVRTELQPDGYVELDGCLRRVRWTAPGEPPAVGEHVRVEQQGGRLVAHGGRNR